MEYQIKKFKFPSNQTVFTDQNRQAKGFEDSKIRNQNAHRTKCALELFASSLNATVTSIKFMGESSILESQETISIGNEGKGHGGTMKVMIKEETAPIWLSNRPNLAQRERERRGSY